MPEEISGHRPRADQIRRDDPAISTHSQQGERPALPPESHPRWWLCVGEHPADVIADLDQALAKI
jgi:hypothetical protein